MNAIFEKVELVVPIAEAMLTSRNRQSLSHRKIRDQIERLPFFAQGLSRSGLPIADDDRRRSVEAVQHGSKLRAWLQQRRAARRGTRVVEECT